MLSKRDLQLVRLAVRWKWFTPEQGEDLLFLKRKFAGKLTLEEIIRRRRYLGDAELKQLSEKADEAMGAARRGRPKTVARGRPAPGTAAAAPAKPSTAQAKSTATLPARSGPSAPARSGPSAPAAPAVLTGPKIPAWDRQLTTVARVPSLKPSGPAQPAGAAQRKLAERPALVRDEFETESKTVVAPLGDAVKEIIARAKAKEAEEAAREAHEENDEEGQFSETTAFLTEEQVAFLKQRAKEHDDDDVDRTTHQDPEELKRALEKERLAQAVDSAQTLFGLPQVIPPPVRPPTNVPLPVVQDVADAERLAEEAIVPEGEFEDEGPPTVGAEEGEEAGVLSGEFGPYLIQRMIGRGKRSVLYLAQAPDGALVALKALEEETEATKGTLVRFQEQAIAAAQIDSPHVVRLIDYGTIDGKAFFATQYVDAWTLEERLDSGDRPDLIESLSIARDVALGLVAAHAVGAVHQDINPDNVLIGRNGEVLIAGFAFPKVVDVAEAANGRQILGTVGYLSPEQAMGLEIDHRTDLYSLGAMLFHLVTGRKTVDSPDPKAALARLLSDPIEDVREIEPVIPESVATVVAKLLSARPDHRYQTASELIEVLARAIEDVKAKGVPTPSSGLERKKQALRLRAAALTAGAVAAAIALPLAVDALVELSSQVALQDAFFGSAGIMIALLLFSALALVRRGELPLPGSSAWLVRVQDAAGAMGAALLVAGLVLGPKAILNVLVASVAVAVLASWIYGILLRRAIALLRPDRGVGRMLAVLGDPNLTRWRMVHVPLLSTLTGLAVLRLAFLAYFASSQSVLN